MLQKVRAIRHAVHREFGDCVAPLLEQELVQKLDTCLQHCQFTRLRHSMDVAYLSFWVTRILGWRCRETARAALLHDLFFHAPGQGRLSLLRSHPGIALGNARKICELTPREEDIILKHMWLLTFSPPRYREGYVVTIVDKFCAGREMVVSLFSRRVRRSVFQPLTSPPVYRHESA